MNIVLVNRPDALTRPGGDTIQMLKTKEALEKYGLSVTIALGPQKPQFYVLFDLVHIFNAQTHTFSLKEAEKVKTVCRPIALSPIYWNYWSMSEFIEGQALWSRKWHLVQKIFGAQGAKCLRKLYAYRWMNKKIFRRIKKLLTAADILLPSARTEKLVLFEFFKLDSYKEKFQIVPVGIDVELFNPEIPLPLPTMIAELGITSNQYILEVARIEPNKNQLALIKAAKQLDVPLVLVGNIGNNVYFKACEEAAKGSTIFFLGPVKYEELPSYYQHARLHALPSWWEIPGLASLEAAAMGCNIVTTCVGSAYDYFKDLAWYCNPFDQESIISALCKAYHEPKSNSLSKMIRKKYSWSNTAKYTIEGYKKLL